MGGAANIKHPDYTKMYDDWKFMRDAVGGECVVKERGTLYLPKPSGFVGGEGDHMYAAYMLRAQFPEILAPTIRGMMGVIHRIPANIELPPALEYLTEVATLDGLPLDSFHRRITREVLTQGRFGVLVDVPQEGGEPYLAGYDAEAIVNWAEEGDFFVLDESGYERDGYHWVRTEKFRVLELNDAGKYQVTMYNDGNLALGVEVIEPKVVKGGTMTEIPFVVIGALDVTPEVDEIPLLSVARAAFAWYRLDADYRHQLYMSGQETLFCIGIDDTSLPRVVGAGVRVAIPAGGDAKYVGPSGTGITLHRQAIMDEKEKAIHAGSRMFENNGQAAESGEALKIRYAAQTATLLSVALASSQGLERALRSAAIFLGVDPDLVIVEPNLSFIESSISAADAVALMGLWQGGAISHETLYENLLRGDIASHERDFEEELELIEAEIDLAPTPEPDLPEDPNTQGAEGGGAEDNDAPGGPQTGAMRNP